MNRWINCEFNRISKARCLILIGPPKRGKTTFAKSLPGHYNYFDGEWRLDHWKNFATYSIYKNVGWDDFEYKGYPDKKQIFTQDGPFLVCNIDFTNKKNSE